MRQERSITLGRSLSATPSSGIRAEGGGGGAGGDGGIGGRGGYGNAFSFGFLVNPGQNGDGGDGGVGGVGGAGGDAAAAVLNVGTALFEGTLANAQFSTSTAGDAGTGGPGGFRGASEGPGLPGENGQTGQTGAAGTLGRGSAIVGATATYADSTFIVQSSADEVAEDSDIQGRTVTFAIRRLGDNEEAATVNWGFTGGTGITAADFENGLPQGGTIKFAAFVSMITFTLVIGQDEVAEAAENFTIGLSVAQNSATKLGWTKTAQVTIAASEGPGPINGSSGDDRNLRGTQGDDVINTLGGNDNAFGLSGRDTINGGSGNDTIVGGAGADTHAGGAGNDTASYETAKLGITASLADRRINTGDAAGDSYALIENLMGSSLADRLSGNAAANRLSGLDGADSLAGGAGSDVLTGGAGNDTLNGGLGLDRMTGGLGKDIYEVNAAGDAVTELSSQGIDSVRSSVSMGQLFANVEYLSLLGVAHLNGSGNSLDNSLVGERRQQHADGAQWQGQHFGQCGQRPALRRPR